MQFVVNVRRLANYLSSLQVTVRSSVGIVIGRERKVKGMAIKRKILSVNKVVRAAEPANRVSQEALDYIFEVTRVFVDNLAHMSMLQQWDNKKNPCKTMLKKHVQKALDCRSRMHELLPLPSSGITNIIIDDEVTLRTAPGNIPDEEPGLDSDNNDLDGGGVNHAA